MVSNPTCVVHRNRNARAALVFIHGFCGDRVATWRDFPRFVMEEPRLDGWDVYGIGYPSSLSVDIRGIWSADPDIGRLAGEFGTILGIEPLDRYRAIAIAAHSMGGLVVQRALLDDAALQARVQHVLLYGTPSGGLVKSRFAAFLKPQLRDMAKGGRFVTRLREDWRRSLGDDPPFSLRVAAGDRDEFVPPESSLEPFPQSMHAVLPGNHLEIVKPGGPDHPSVALLVGALTRRRRAIGAIDSARLAVERGEFRAVVRTLGTRAARLDDVALVALALALDGLDRGDEALAVLEASYRGGSAMTDVLGVLAGRIKRRWLVGRERADWKRACELYGEGLRRAKAERNADQAHYHAINLAFLALMAQPPAAPVGENAQAFAREALEQCRRASAHFWRTATEAEAQAILGNRDEALALYRKAARAAKAEPRAIDSMYGQAVEVMSRIYGKDSIAALDGAFGRAEDDG